MRGLRDPLLRPSMLEEVHPRPVPTEPSARASTEHGLSSHLRVLTPGVHTCAGPASPQKNLRILLGETDPCVAQQRIKEP